MGGRVVDQGEEDGDEERPLFGDELGLGRCGTELVCFVIRHMRYPDTPLRIRI